jgi:uncharacterized membrane protein YcaP (DUF421 family)
MSGVKHLGQVDTAYIEASGKMSVFFLPDEKVDFGLPILPELFEQQMTEIKEPGIYSCSYCGHTEKITAVNEHACINCKGIKWVRSSNETRVK